MEISAAANRKYYRIGNTHVSLSSRNKQWNKVEHKLFCFITKSWQGKPLIDIKTVVNLFSNTTTKTGLKVKCVVDTRRYELKQKMTDEQAETINMQECDQFGNWNYIIRPNK